MVSAAYLPAGLLPRLLFALLLAAPVGVFAGVAASSDYNDLIDLTGEFFAWRDAGRDPLDQSWDFATERRTALAGFQARLGVIEIANWKRGQQADYLALRSALDQEDFYLQVSRPWERDPGYYIDRMLRLGFTELPLSGEDLPALQTGLRATVQLADTAQRNLRDVPRDLGALAIHKLTQADGVGHGHPYRAVPPNGVIGWYEDLLQRARQQQPALIDDIETARDAARGLHAWLLKNQDNMTADAGVGEALLDWYLMHVKFMPYSSDEIDVLAQRELERTWAFYALEQHRNRDLPELKLPGSREEYEARIAAVDRDIRAFIREQQFITIPDYIPRDFREVGFNVPWIERDGGPNYWEQIQYRDPSPDHWHAVIPGHRIDSRMLATIEHPIRRHFRDGGRMEGWALYLEETPLQLGYYAQRPRARELIYNFGIFRAARTLGDLRLQRNEISIPEVVKFWRSRTPWLDENVARVDAEIYLRRPPGYGLGYTVGSFQMFKLLAERKQQLGDDFDLGEFHDQVMAAGAIPIALIRYEMTGLDDEVRHFRSHRPLTDVLEDLGIYTVNTLYITGAGVSAESGIPTFRGTDGFWTVGSKNYTPQEMATRAMYKERPLEFLRWYYHRFATYRDHGPNPVHEWLADKNLITQNIDGLDGKAGNRDYIAIHGRVDQMTVFHDESLAHRVRPVSTPWNEVDEHDLDASLLRIFNIEDRPQLNNSFKPYVLLFDEYYTELYRIGEAQRRMLIADRIVFMGTSFSVNITLMALEAAKTRNTPVEVVDPEPVETYYHNTTYHEMTALEYITRVV